MERLELLLLHRGENERREYWTDEAGRLLLHRRREEPLWQARLDRDVAQMVLDDGTVLPLQAEDVQDLADLLVLETGVQAVFDDEGRWQEDVTGWPVRVARPRRPQRA